MWSDNLRSGPKRCGMDQSLSWSFQSANQYRRLGMVLKAEYGNIGRVVLDHQGSQLPFITIPPPRQLPIIMSKRRTNRRRVEDYFEDEAEEVNDLEDDDVPRTPVAEAASKDEFNTTEPMFTPTPRSRDSSAGAKNDVGEPFSLDEFELKPDEELEEEQSRKMRRLGAPGDIKFMIYYRLIAGKKVPLGFSIPNSSAIVREIKDHVVDAERGHFAPFFINKDILREKKLARLPAGMRWRGSMWRSLRLTRCRR